MVEEWPRRRDALVSRNWLETVEKPLHVRDGSRRAKTFRNGTLVRENSYTPTERPDASLGIDSTAPEELGSVSDAFLSRNGFNGRRNEASGHFHAASGRDAARRDVVVSFSRSEDRLNSIREYLERKSSRVREREEERGRVDSPREPVKRSNGSQRLIVENLR